MKPLKIGDVITGPSVWGPEQELVVLGITLKGHVVTFEAVTLAAAERMGIHVEPESAA